MSLNDLEKKNLSKIFGVPMQTWENKGIKTCILWNIPVKAKNMYFFTFVLWYLLFSANTADLSKIFNQAKRHPD